MCMHECIPHVCESPRSEKESSKDSVELELRLWDTWVLGTHSARSSGRAASRLVIPTALVLALYEPFSPSKEMSICEMMPSQTIGN